MAGTTGVAMDVGSNRVAIVTLSNPPANVVTLSSEGGKFSSGFDLEIVQKAQKSGDVSLMPDFIHRLAHKIEDGIKPFVAAVQDLAVGGGLEFAMLSKPITAEEGRKLGLVDAVVPPHELLKVSCLWALDIAERRKPWIRSLQVTHRLGSLSEVHNIVMTARQEAKKAAQNLPLYQACLDVIEEEYKVLKELLLADTTKGLLHIFFAQRTALKVPGVTDVGLKPRHIKKVAVIGGGLMGSGITTALLLSNVYVVLKEINSEVLSKGIKSIEDNIRGLMGRGKLAQDKATKALSLLRGVLDYSEFKDVDMVIEAVFENVTLKQTIFSEIEKSCPPHCIFASNTTAIDLSAIGESTNSQERIIGTHFFSPAHIMPLVEIIRTNMTSPQVILDLIALAKTMKKVPIVVRNCTGFAVSRIVFTYTQSAHLLANLGIDVFRIDCVIKDFGLPMGPFQLQDLMGYGVALSVEKHLASAFPDCAFRSPLVELLVKSGRNGKNNGKGYYIYEEGSKPKPDPSVLAIIEESRKLTNIMPSGKPIFVSDKEILEMILFPVVNEACRILDEGVVLQSSDLDVASVLGMSFPSFHGGIVFWADQVGPTYIYESLKKWANLYGSFFKPSGFLEDRVVKSLTLGKATSTSSTTMSRL